MKQIDPDGFERRKRERLRRRTAYSAGPNEIWSFDGHDKLSVAFGLAIHGCVDWYSGKFIWLNVFTTNHNPQYVAKLYLTEVFNRRV